MYHQGLMWTVILTKGVPIYSLMNKPRIIAGQNSGRNLQLPVIHISYEGSCKFLGIVCGE